MDKIKIYINILISENESGNVYYNEENNIVNIYINQRISYDEIINIIKNNYDTEERLTEIKEYEEKNKIEEMTSQIKKFNDELLKDNFEIEICDIGKVNNNVLPMIEELSKKSKILDCSRCNIDDLDKIIKDKNISDSIKIITKYNYLDESTKKETNELLEYLLNIKKYAEHFNLSPLEKSLFVYDLIRERQFKEASEDDINKSRSLYTVYNSNYIVCAGFSKLYSAILDLLSIKSTEIVFYDAKKEEGHMSNLVYLNDNKYDEHKIFEVDATWGIKKNKDKSNNYIDTLKYYFMFGQPLKNAIIIKKLQDLDFENKNPFCSDKNIVKLEYSIKQIESLEKLNAPMLLMKDIIEKNIKKIEEINNIINHPYISEKLKFINSLKNDENKNQNEKYEEIINEIKNITLLLKSKSINYDNFVMALYHVKLVEHSIDKDKFPFDELSFSEATASASFLKTKEEKLLDVLFNNLSVKQCNEDIELDSARTSFISTIHKIAKDNIDNNPVKPKNKYK